MKKIYQAYDPLVQVGIWVVTVFERLRLLAAQAGGVDRERPLPAPM